MEYSLLAGSWLRWPANYEKKKFGMNIKLEDTFSGESYFEVLA